VALCCDLPFAFAVGTPDFAMVLPNVRSFAAVAQVSFSVTLVRSLQQKKVNRAGTSDLITADPKMKGTKQHESCFVTGGAAVSCK
jgi:hypothetical protein